VPSFVLYARGRHSHIAARSAPISSTTHFNEGGGTRIRAKRIGGSVVTQRGQHYGMGEYIKRISNGQARIPITADSRSLPLVDQGDRSFLDAVSDCRGFAVVEGCVAPSDHRILEMGLGEIVKFRNGDKTCLNKLGDSRSMPAGEHAIAALADVGLMEVVNTRFGRWTEAGKQFRRDEAGIRAPEPTKHLGQIKLDGKQEPEN
jgi:hypothetical protein